MNYGYWRRLLLFPDAADGGGGAAAAAAVTPTLNAFVQTLPPELQAEKSLHNIDSPVTLAKGYVHAQKLIGAKRLAAPDGTWGDNQWNEFYEAAGRPKTADEYKLPTIEGLDPKSVDAARWKATAADLHKAGLSQRQADVVLSRYFGDIAEQAKQAKLAETTRMATAEATLKTAWGDKYDVNMDLAKSVLQKFGDTEFMEYVNQQGGNDPRLIKSLARIGAAMMEDKSRGGNAADGLQVTDATRATQEMSRLKADPDFLKAYTTKNHPGHAGAVQQMMNLQKIAASGKQKEE
jgi:hypothetical protein